MLKSFFIITMIISVAAMVPIAVQAQEASGIVPRLRLAAEADPKVSVFLRGIGNQINRQRQDRTLRSLLETLYDVAPQGSLTLEQIERRITMDQAKLRAASIGKLLAWDLNADGSISQSERKAFTGNDAVGVELLFARADMDDDGVVSLTELFSYASAEALANVRQSNYEHLMLFDVDQDGTVTASEIVATITALEKDPLIPVSNTERPLTTPSRTPRLICDAPKPTDDSTIIVLSGYEGAALSSVSIVGMDRVTHVGRVVIEPGQKSIYLFLSAHSFMIWDIVGATDRIAGVVVQKGRVQGEAGAGVLGIPQDKVHFVAFNSCLKPIYSIEGGDGIIAYRQMTESLGREPDNMHAHYTIGSISLPSGAGTKVGGEGTDIIIYDGKRYEITPEGPKLIDEAEGQSPGDQPYGASQTFRSLKRFNPGGIRAIDADAVVAPGDATTYDVMPQEAGLLQLLLEQKIRYTRDGFYIISKPIARFPAGLAGAHQVKFMLAEGVQMPSGSSGHSPVYSAETGKCIAGYCR
ncbi:MAG: hypothetical protein V3V13_04505 [Paracoccaceae bacterium]